MDLKNYIAAFFIIIFLGKMLSIDAKILSLIFETSQVTMVNKLCPKKQLQKESSGEYATDGFNSSYEIDYLCNVAFDIRISEWDEELSQNIFRKHSYRAPGDFSIPGERFYPPPKA